MEAVRARVRCDWAKFKELSSTLTVCVASYHIKCKISRACVQSVLTYGSETWALKAEIVHSLERAERMMVRCKVLQQFLFSSSNSHIDFPGIPEFPSCLIPLH